MADNNMPAAFLAHGSPMNALEENHFTDDWNKLCANFPKPKAIVIFSAHWHIPGTVIQSQPHQQTIHDFGGFPQTLFDYQYPAAGAPELAERIQQLFTENGFKSACDNSWGLDHGSWVILKHLYPDADIPCLQISLDNQNNNLEYHYSLAQSLKPIRKEGVLFLGSGNIVHNIAKWMMSKPEDSIDWATEFDRHVFKAIENMDLNSLFHYNTLPHASDAAPTIEHFLPLIYILGLRDKGDQLKTSNFGFQDLSTACSRSIIFTP